MIWSSSKNTGGKKLLLNCPGICSNTRGILCTCVLMAFLEFITREHSFIGREHACAALRDLWGTFGLCGWCSAYRSNGTLSDVLPRREEGGQNQSTKKASVGFKTGDSRVWGGHTDSEHWQSEGAPGPGARVRPPAPAQLFPPPCFSPREASSSLAKDGHL